MSIAIGNECGFKFIHGLNNDNTVVLAENTANSETVVLREAGQNSLNIYKRILKCPHENVENVQKIIRVKNGYIAVCGFCKGIVLRELMAQDVTIVRACIVQIANQLCNAACHLYKLGIVHRDITPNNIIVDYKRLENKLNVKLIDFDISRVRYGSKAHDTTIFGTVGYAAPEQYGFQDTNFQTDIYAIGRVIGDMIKVCGFSDNVNQKLWEFVIQKCTMYSPNDRYGSYKIMKNDISEIWLYKRTLSTIMSGYYRRVFKELAFDKQDANSFEDDPLILH